MTKLGELKGMTPTILQGLQDAGIKTADKLLEAGTTRKQRTDLAKQVGCEQRDLLELCNRADLSRVKGVSGVYSDLLEAAGVDTVKELATRKPENLAAKIKEVNEQKQLTPRPPNESQCSDWVAQAKELPKILTY